ncbi:MAG: chromosome segregation protein SMC [Clostridiales bacterium]|nr:chromosome segregation protein SMC [Clostridiales bacterium]
MYLKSLELQGFKSFPDKYKLEFNKGLTAVVGPNGSGKSNIGDAVRWVLGEQSSKNLRGDKMEDVIFSGTEKRKPVGFAQVSLNIDNCDRALQVDSDMVSVSRKLYRNGDSEYLINGAKVRLKDVVELFMDTGLGRDGYSVIGQGRIAEIVSSKSADRREIFEEAAGISKFRYKKQEAERKLIAAEDNILRLRDIISELESRVEPLRIQSEKAKKFRELDNEKRKLEISVWVQRLDDLNNVLSGMEDKLLVSNSEYENLSRELDELDELIEEAFSDRAKCTENIELIREKIHQIELDNSNANSKIAVLENDISHINESINSVQQMIEQAESSKQDLEINIEKKEIELEEILKSKAQAKELILETEKQLSDLSQKSNEFDITVNNSNAELNRLYIKKSELSFKLENAKNIISDVEEEALLAVETVKNSRLEYENAEIELNELEIAIENVNQEITNENNKLNGYTILYKKRSEQLAESENDYRNKDIKVRELKQRLGILNDLENSLEGFSRSVKQVIKASKQGQIKGIFGSVAQIISVDSKYSLAVETALGGALQNVVVDTEETAKRGIRLLKETNAGRATFLPLTSVKGKVLQENRLEGEDGYVSLACDIVKFDSKFSGVINQLLGRTVVAEDINMATLIAKKYGYKFRIVTLDGQIINVGGSFTGGSSSRSTGILTRKNEIEEIESRITKLTSDFEILKERHESLNQQTQKLHYDIEGVKEIIGTLNGDKIRFDGEFKRLDTATKQYQIDIKDIENKIEGYKLKLENSNADIDVSQTTLEETQVSIEKNEGEIQSSNAYIQGFKSNREELSQKISDLRIKETELNKDEQSCNLAVEQLKISAINSDTNRTEYVLQINEYKKQIEQKKSEILLVKESLLGADTVIDEHNLKISEEQMQYLKHDREATEYRNTQKIKQEEKETVSKEITRLSEKRTTVQNDFDKIISELWEQYELSRTDAKAQAILIVDMTVSTKRLNELKSKIRGLGSVNLTAIEEYEEVSERYEFMSTQLNDVEKSKADLERIIAELTENMKIIFVDSFNKINENFKIIFMDLFGGGKAELTLSDPENVLECGININVAPPGKVIKNLSLLSGGEQSFVAICIYFAILKISPSPFCLLDEIEAALDDVNVTKYAQYLRRFTKTTQFILITHRRGTMEEADVLYGVTMQEKGISKLLKMNVGDTIELE